MRKSVMAARFGCRRLPPHGGLNAQIARGMSLYSAPDGHRCADCASALVERPRHRCLGCDADFCDEHAGRHAAPDGGHVLVPYRVGADETIEARAVSSHVGGRVERLVMAWLCLGGSSL